MSSNEAPRPMPRAVLTEQVAESIAADAYVFGYPLVLMDITKRIATAVPNADGFKAPVNQLAHASTLAEAPLTEMVLPNADTLESTAWLDLTEEPVVLSVPAMGNRHNLLQLSDAWSNVFASPGTRTMGNHEREILIFGPGWRGRLPRGVTAIRSPTSLAWLIGHTQVRGRRDCEAVRALQAQYSLVPLSGIGAPYIPPAVTPGPAGLDVDTPAVEQLATMDANAFFGRLAVLMRDNPPADVDGMAMARFGALGIRAGEAFNLSALPAPHGRGIVRGLRTGFERIVEEVKKPLGRQINGWSVMTNLGRYGSNYLLRAVSAVVGLGAALPEDLLCPHAAVDGRGQPLVGTNRYVLHFSQGRLPPVDGFWSVTLYNTRHGFVKNPIDRYAIRDRDPLSYEPDGALTLYLQYEPPGDDIASNWLPTPVGAFTLMMRLYSPRRDALDGTWSPPSITRVG